MFRHVVLLRFDSDTPAEHVDLVADRLRELPGTIPALRAYTVGRDAGLAADNAQLAVLAEFDDVEGYLAYRDDPGHRRIIDEMILPHLASRSAVQFDDGRA